MSLELSYNEAFADRVSSLCIAKYHKLPKTGKPNLNESQWTLLSGICLEEGQGKLSVVALATGTKCLGVTSYSAKGDVVHDSHAEVLTRRAWLRYLYSQINLTLSGKSSRVFDLVPRSDTPHCDASAASNGVQFKLKPNIKFHFYTSHTPCGDASIFPRKIKQKTLTKIQNQSKRLKMEKDYIKKRKLAGEPTDSLSGVPDSIVENDLPYEGQNGLKRIVESGLKEEKSSDEFEVVEKRKKVEMEQSPVISTTLGVTSSSQGEANDLNGGVNDLEKSVNIVEGKATDLETSSEESEGEDLGSLVEDFHRTGAKTLRESSRQDPKGVAGPEFQYTGVVRTKPGRGDPTYSVSCSDKIAKWSVVGWEGTLISTLLTSPIQMSSITVGGGVPFSQAALERALLTRVSQCVLSPAPALLHSQVEFPGGKRNTKRELKKLGRPLSLAHPVGASIIWCDVDYKPLQVSIEGIRQGTSRKKHNISNAHSTLLVSSYKLLLQYIKVTRNQKCLDVPYDRLKHMAPEYQARMQRCKEALGKWMDVPEQFRQFCVKDINEKL